MTYSKPLVDSLLLAHFLIDYVRGLTLECSERVRKLELLVALRLQVESTRAPLPPPVPVFFHRDREEDVEAYITRWGLLVCDF